MKPVLNRGHPCTFRRFQINGRHFKSRLETKSWRVADGPKKPCAVLADLKAGWRMLPVEPECDSVMSRQTLIHFFPNQYHTHPDRQGLTKAFCRAHFPSLHPSFPLSSPSLSVSVPAYQTWQYQLAAGKLTARGYKLLWEYLYRRWGGGGGVSVSGRYPYSCLCLHARNPGRRPALWAFWLTGAWCSFGAGPRAIFNSYKDSCQHLLEAAVYFTGGLAFARLPAWLTGNHSKSGLFVLSAAKMCALLYFPAYRQSLGNL